MNLIYIYGPPGAGKLTVAEELARATGYKLFHNHVSIDCVQTVFDFGTKSFFKLVGQIRFDMLEEAAREGVNVIFTFVYAHPADAPTVERICASVERHGGRVCPVQLTCDKNVLEQRLQSQARARWRKLSSPDRLREIMEQHDLFAPFEGRDSLRLDNTGLAPAEAAARIIEHYGIVASSQ